MGNNDIYGTVEDNGNNPDVADRIIEMNDIYGTAEDAEQEQQQSVISKLAEPKLTDWGEDNNNNGYDDGIEMYEAPEDVLNRQGEHDQATTIPEDLLTGYEDGGAGEDMYLDPADMIAQQLQPEQPLPLLTGYEDGGAGEDMY